MSIVLDTSLLIQYEWSDRPGKRKLHSAADCPVGLVRGAYRATGACANRKVNAHRKNGDCVEDMGKSNFQSMQDAFQLRPVDNVALVRRLLQPEVRGQSESRLVIFSDESSKDGEDAIECTTKLYFRAKIQSGR